MKERIAELLNKENLSSSKFADLIGVQRSSISHILSGRNNPSLDFIQKILLKFNYINSDWLISGQGDMYKSDSPKSNELDMFSSLGDSLSETPRIPTPEIPDNKRNKTKLGSADLFSISKEDDGRQIERVVVFFTDKTFREYKPS